MNFPNSNFKNPSLFPKSSLDCCVVIFPPYPTIFSWLFVINFTTEHNYEYKAFPKIFPPPKSILFKKTQHFYHQTPFFSGFRTLLQNFFSKKRFFGGNPVRNIDIWNYQFWKIDFRNYRFHCGIPYRTLKIPEKLNK